MLPSIRAAGSLCLGVLLAVAGVADAKSALGIKNGKVSVTSTRGDESFSLKEPSPLPSHIALEVGSTFKLSFSVVDTSSGKAVNPQQAHLLFEDHKGEDVTLPVTLKSGGKASFIINTAKPPPALLATHGAFNLTLLLSTLDTAAIAPLYYPLGSLSLPHSILQPLPRKRHDLPPRAGEPAFKPEQELFHTFREEERSVGWVKSLVGTGSVLAPWAVLASLFGKISPQLNFISPAGSSLAFVACLLGLEVFIFIYWIGLKLYQFLPYFLIGCAGTAYIGKIALGSLRQQRLKAGGAP